MWCPLVIKIDIHVAGDIDTQKMLARWDKSLEGFSAGFNKWDCNTELWEKLFILILQICTGGFIWRKWKNIWGKN